MTEVQLQLANKDWFLIFFLIFSQKCVLVPKWSLQPLPHKIFSITADV